MRLSPPVPPLYFEKRVFKRLVLIILGLLSIYAVARGVTYLYSFVQLIDNRFPLDKGLPSGIYARPLELHQGAALLAEELALELTLLNYRHRDSIDTSGSFSRKGGHFVIFSRAFQFPNGKADPRKISVIIENDRIKSIIDLDSGKSQFRFRLEPLPIGHLFPKEVEYRGFIRIESVPPLLVKTILAVEDQHFYDHPGADFGAVLRAILVNLKKGHVAQGGSTITQQLARHLFFSREQTLQRKLDETIMALLLECLFSKQELLEAYINEVYLGQAGKMPIKGFAEAGVFYFSRDIRDLQIKEIALLVGMLKGPSAYNPTRAPNLAVKRRNIVLQVMAQQQLISYAQANQARSEPVALYGRPRAMRFPAFVDFVRRRFDAHYPQSSDIGKTMRTEGIRVFTTCDPIIQLKAEKGVDIGLAAIQARPTQPAKGNLETGVIVAATGDCNVLAVIGGRDFRFEGFNRAIDARRPIGSIIKPAYFLTALEQPQHYNLMTPIDNSALTVDQGAGHQWTPKNFAPGYSGQVPLYRALSQSFNTASARLGMALGLEKCLASLRNLGYQKQISFYPSTLLGSVAMSPMEVAGIYHTFASGGLNTPIRVISSICDRKGRLLNHFSISNRQRAFSPEATFLLNVILQKAVSQGTIGKLYHRHTQHLDVAGKTGTSDDFRDSWFAGFTGDKLAVVWVGKDDFGPTRLTGADGAFIVWDEIISRISHKPFKPEKPQNVEWVDIDPRTGFKIEEPECAVAITMPYISGFSPKTTITCREAEVQNQNQQPFQEWIRRGFN